MSGYEVLAVVVYYVAVVVSPVVCFWCALATGVLCARLRWWAERQTLQELLASDGCPAEEIAAVSLSMMRECPTIVSVWSLRAALLWRNARLVAVTLYGWLRRLGGTRS